MSAVLLSQVLSASAASGARGAATLLVVAVAGYFGWIELPESLDVLATVPGIAVLATFAVLEELAEGDEDLQELLELGNYVLRAALGAFVAYTVAAGADGGVVEASASTGVLETASPVAGAALATGTHHLRAKLHASARGFGDSALSPRSWLVWLERGGVAGVLVAVVFAPVIALAFVLLASVAAGIALLVRRQVERTVYRRACPGCGHLARVEASRCPSCSATLDVERWLVAEQGSTASRLAKVLG